MDLYSRIEDKTAVVGIIGLGYVGLPLLRTFCDAGFHVIGFDIDETKVSRLQAGINYLKHLDDSMVERIMATGRCEVTADMTRLAEPDAIVSCVPTPLNDQMEPDLTYIEQTAMDIAKVLRRAQLVVLESSTYPGTTRNILMPALCSSGLTFGEHFFLAYSPEREDPGNATYTTENIPKLVGGIDQQSTDLAVMLYSAAIKEVVPVASAEVAEAAKMLENIYRSVNIAMVNEMKVILHRMNIDIWEVIEAASSKPFGFQAFYPGPGLGGHCLPIDPYYFAWIARQNGLPTRFIELAGDINRQMPDYVMEQTASALKQQGKQISGSKILILGVAYKPDIDDVRESPGCQLIWNLQKLGAEVDYHDPHVEQLQPTRKFSFNIKRIDFSLDRLKTYDCVIVVTDHSAYDWQAIGESSQLLIDTRNALRAFRGDRSHIFKS